MARPKSGKGGYRQPANPAPVSNPGSGRRTDGGPGSDRQPLRAPTGQQYGERKASLDQQRAAPLAASASPGTQAQPQQRQPQRQAFPPLSPDGIFGPSERGDTRGMIPSQTPIEQTPDVEEAIRAMYQAFPSPWLLRLMNGRPNTIQ